MCKINATKGKIMFLTCPYLPTEAICWVSGKKFRSDIQTGLLKFNQSCGRFFSRNICFCFSRSNNFTLFSVPPVAITFFCTREWHILFKFSPASTNTSPSPTDDHRLITPDPTDVKIDLK